MFSSIYLLGIEVAKSKPLGSFFIIISNKLSSSNSLTLTKVFPQIKTHLKPEILNAVPKKYTNLLACLASSAFSMVHTRLSWSPFSSFEMTKFFIFSHSDNSSSKDFSCDFWIQILHEQICIRGFMTAHSYCYYLH